MISLDNSATTYPKPDPVRRAVADAMVRFGANPGRAGHRMAMQTSEAVFRARETAAQFFHTDVETVIFTPGCTQAINQALKGYLHSGDHAVISCLEHNAVYRPITAMQADGVSFTVARVFPGDDDRTLESFASCIKSNTRLLVCTQASNVFGIRLPVERLAALAHEHGAAMLVDAAQSAGVVDIDLSRTPIDFLCCAGHKGLYGPMGTGLLIARERLDPIVEGGTGSQSASPFPPDEYPDRLEAGTPNTPGILGLAAGIRFVQQKTVARIFRHETALLTQLYRPLAHHPKLIWYGDPSQSDRVPVLSLNVAGQSSEETAAQLDRAGIAVRAGLHCAPLAHRWMGTADTGTVRVSVSAFSRPADINRLTQALRAVIN